MGDTQGVDECGASASFPIRKPAHELSAGMYQIKNDYFVHNDFGMRRVVLLTLEGEDSPVYRCYLPAGLYLPTAPLTKFKLEKADLESDEAQPRFMRSYNLVLHRPEPGAKVPHASQ